MKNQNGNATIGLLAIAIVLFVGLSWAFNIVRLIDCDFASPYKCEVVHGVGLIPIVSVFTVWVGTDTDTKQ